MKKYAEIDRSGFPIVKVVFTGESAQADNFPHYLEEVRQSYDNKTPLAIIFDAGKASLPGLTYQKMQAKWLKDNHNLMTTFCRGTAYVIPNPIVRNVLQAIFTIQPQPVPYLVCSTYQEAEAWAHQQLGTKH
ncbi:STAS/SEC14 domain-containing protein [Rhodoflexus sp.]